MVVHTVNDYREVGGKLISLQEASQPNVYRKPGLQQNQI